MTRTRPWTKSPGAGAATPTAAAPPPAAGLVAQSSDEDDRAPHNRPDSPVQRAAEGRTPEQALRVLLVSRPGLFADGFARSLKALAGAVEVARLEASEAMCIPRASELVLVDLDGLGCEAAGTVRTLRQHIGAPLVAIADAFDLGVMGSILSAGAAAFLAKSYSEAQALRMLREVLEQRHVGRRALPPSRAAGAGAVQSSWPVSPASPVHRAGMPNPYRLTNAEMAVLALVCEGLSNLAICKRRRITEGTVKVQLYRIYRKLGVQSRTQAARIGERLDAIREIQLRRAGDTRTVFDWLLPHMNSEARRAGEVLFQRGDSGDALYFVQRGRVQLAEIGVEVGEGEVLGEVGLFSPQHARTCTARCTMDTRLFRLDRDQVQRLYFENPQFAYHLMQLIAARLTMDRERL